MDEITNNTIGGSTKESKIGHGEVISDPKENQKDGEDLYIKLKNHMNSKIIERWIIFIGSTALISIGVVIALVIGKQMYSEHILPIKEQLLDTVVHQPDTSVDSVESIASEKMAKKLPDVLSVSGGGKKHE